MSTAIKFENISKQYRLGLVSTNTISHDLKRWWVTSVRGKEDPYLKIGEVNDRSTKGTSDYVWALKDINFDVQQGDVLGIIGKNGAGKSTLLKILSKVTAPTTGTIKAAGRIASLLEVGTGFHPEMTGRENIYMNGAIMGMTKAEINRKLDEIVDFSGVERYIDTPAKRYSSGMTVRLGFAIAAHLDPEILVVDEVLAVGDAEFQKKAIGKMQDVSKGEGRTVLFVSHNMDAMLNLCKRGLLLENGIISHAASIQETVHFYLNQRKLVNQEYDVISSTKPIYLKKIWLSDIVGKKGNDFTFDNQISINVSIYNQLTKISENTILQIPISDEKGIRLFTIEKRLNECVQKFNKINVQAILPQSLIAPGNYFLEVSIQEPNVQLFDLVNETCPFTILDSGTEYVKFSSVQMGYFVVNAKWKDL